MIVIRSCLVALLVVVASCSGAGASSSSAPVPRGDPYVISKEEMQNPVIASMDALKAIQYLRPAFFRTSGPQSFGNASAGSVQYSLDFGPLRPVSELSTVNPTLLYEVRYLNIADAQNRFGLNANGGPVIVLLNNKQP
ncbi:MAG: hypothetical protein ABIT20_24725 [Gemmatimonadaceae bacterium]